MSALDETQAQGAKEASTMAQDSSGHTEIGDQTLTQRQGISRRSLLTGAAGLHLGLYVAAKGGRSLLALVGADGSASGVLAQSGGAEAGTVLTTFVSVATDGTATILIPSPDIGQGVRTSLAQLVAEELAVPWEAVQVAQAPAGNSYGRQGVGGSGTIRSHYTPLRQAGAAARTMLIGAAADRWSVPASECEARDGFVHHTASGRRFGYGELAEAAADQPLPNASSLRLKAPADFDIIGQPLNRVDNHDVVVGRAVFGLDARPPGEGLRYCVVARPAALGARLESYDGPAALAVPGVLSLVPGVGGGIAVVGETTYAAIRGREALDAQWDTSPQAALDSNSIRADLEAGVSAPAPPSNAAATVEAEFDLPYLAHAPMEPMNCTVKLEEDRCTVWAPTQSPQGVQRAVARGVGLPESAVEVRPTLAGGGFGRRGTSDFAGEVAAVAKAVGGSVQLLWTRDDDLCHAAYRPASHHKLAGGVDDNGRVTSYVHRMAISSTRGNDDIVDNEVERAARAASAASLQQGSGPYDIPGYGVQRSGVRIPVPTTFWRSVDSSQVNFANECFLDMLAVAADADPVEFRRAHIRQARLRPLLDLAAEGIGWGEPLPVGTGLGVACYVGYGSFVAQTVRVRVSPEGEVRVERVYCAVDCGVAINPSSIRAQMEGCVSDAVATTLFAAITLDEGRIEQEGFWSYEWTRMSDMPRVDVEIVDSTASPGGMGELGYPAVSPAICNAIFAATGRRVTRVPLRAEDLAGWTTDPGGPGGTPTPEPTPIPTEAPDPVNEPIYMPRVVDES